MDRLDRRQGRTLRDRSNYRADLQALAEVQVEPVFRIAMEEEEDFGQQYADGQYAFLRNLAFHEWCMRIAVEGGMWERRRLG